MSADSPPPVNSQPDAPSSAELRAMLRTLLDQVYAQLAPDDQHFVGREFLQKRLDEFIQSPNRMPVIVGPPGVGKTAFAAHLIDTHLDQAAPYLGHFCSLPDGENPLLFCQNLANQLRALLGADYVIPEVVNGKKLQVDVHVESVTDQAQVIGAIIKNVTIGSIHPREAFRTLIREPLQAYHTQFGGLPDRSPLVIVIDAIDRSWQWDGGQGANIVSLLLEAQDLPAWVNIVCTARPGAAVQALRSRAGVVVEPLEPLSTANLQDIARFVQEQLIDGLDQSARQHLLDLVRKTYTKPPAEPARVFELFQKQIVDASQGNFSYVRRYVGALLLALYPTADQPPVNPSALLSLTFAGLQTALQANYAAIYAQMRQSLDLDQGDADDEVLGTLALAFEPLNYSQLRQLSRWPGSPDALKDSLSRLAPVITTSGPASDQRLALYHAGFAEYVRQSLVTAGREHDLHIARTLENALNLPEMQDYAARYRWEHILRGLQLRAQPGAPDTSEASPKLPAISWRSGLQQIQELAPDMLSQVQLLRLLAEQALSPDQADVQGSWSAALGYLSEAERILNGSTAVRRYRNKPARLNAEDSAEILELGRTLIALGDACRTIAQRMDTGLRLFQASSGHRNLLFRIWDSIVRMPLAIFLLFVLLAQGVREFYLPGAIQNLGRGQDWSIARLYILSISAYRRASLLVRRQDNPILSYEISERLGRTYMQMGAYDAAAASYDSLLSQTAALITPWYQAVWQLARGEVELAKRHPERAIEMLHKALLTFKMQQSPVPQARALSGLAMAYALQAELGQARHDDTTFDLVDSALEHAAEALQTWKQVSSLEEDDSSVIDPDLARSQIGNLLWSISQQEYPDEQKRRAQLLRRSIDERHFPQVFEHPLVRLFRVTATILLPAILLLGLLLAVQRPSTFLVNTDFDLAFEPPLLDLSTFPNALIDSSGARPNSLSATDLSQIVVGSRWSQLTPAPPQLRLPTFSLIGAAWLGLQLLFIYFLVYLIIGLCILAVASPEHHQQRRPGRLILKKEMIIWRGPPALGLERDILRWAAQEARKLAGSLRQVMLRILGNSLSDDQLSPFRGSFEIATKDILRVIILDRRLYQWPLGDFSFTQLILRPGARPLSSLTSIYIPGSLAYYDELRDDLGQMFRGRCQVFPVEMVRSLSGFLFFIVLIFSMLLALLTIFQVAFLQTPLPILGYTLNDLYILVAPGLLLPLLWWIVIQPLAARAVRGGAFIPLVLASLIGGALMLFTLMDSDRLNVLGIQPDLVTPILAVGILLAIVIGAPERPLRSIFSNYRTVGRALLAVLALAAMSLLIVHMGQTLAWYHQLVRGNQAIRTALSEPACTSDQSCPEFDEALSRYSALICLRPAASEGYAFRGFVEVASGRYDAARQDLFVALQVSQGMEPPALQGCSYSFLPRFANQHVLPLSDLAGLRGNLAAASLLLARQQSQSAIAAPLYQEAINHLVHAIDESGPAEQKPLSDLLSQPLEQQCLAVAQALKQKKVGSRQAVYVVQLGDTCYSSAFSRIRNTAQFNLSGQHGPVWTDLQAAVMLYERITRELPTSTQRQAARGKAAVWLILSQLSRPADVQEPGFDPQSYLLVANRAYNDPLLLDHQDEQRNESVYAGQAWTTLLLGAWDEADLPLQHLEQIAPTNATYPALRGLIAWLNSTRYSERSTDYQSTYQQHIQQALVFYKRVADLREQDRSRVLATRSVLYYNLRLSQRQAEYNLDDYGYWMRLAINEMNQALLDASNEGLSQTDQVGYRYWRGRLSFSLAYTWQRKLRGLHAWSELAPLYSQALDDFSEGATYDTNNNRRANYIDQRIPWARYMLSTAVHMQQAELAIDSNDYEAARRELTLVQPLLSASQKRQWDEFAEPRPEYSLLHGLISLALNQPADFLNPMLSTEQSAEASYAQALHDMEDSDFVSDTVRPTIYRKALDRLDQVLGLGTLRPETRQTAIRIRAQLLAGLTAQDTIQPAPAQIEP